MRRIILFIVLMVSLDVMAGCNKNEKTYGLENDFNSYQFSKSYTKDEAIELYDEALSKSEGYPSKTTQKYWSKLGGKDYKLAMLTTYTVIGELNHLEAIRYNETYYYLNDPYEEVNMYMIRYYSDNIVYTVENENEIIKKYKDDIADYFKYDQLPFSNLNAFVSYDSIRAGKLNNGQIMIECESIEVPTRIRYLIDDNRKIVYQAIQSLDGAEDRVEYSIEYGIFNIEPPEGYLDFPDKE